MAPSQPAGTTTPLPPAVGWSASAFAAAVLARLIRKGLELQGDLDDAAASHLRRLEGLLPSVWRVLDAADAGAVDVGGLPLRDLLDGADAADDALDDVELALHGVADHGDHGAVAEARRSPTGSRKPRSPLRFLLCFSPPRPSVAAHGKISKARNGNVDLGGLRDALETMAQASLQVHVEPEKNYATIVSGRTEDDGAGEAAEQDDDIFGREAKVEQVLDNLRSSDDPHYRLVIGKTALLRSCSSMRSSGQSSPCGRIRRATSKKAYHRSDDQWSGRA